MMDDQLNISKFNNLFSSLYDFRFKNQYRKVTESSSFDSSIVVYDVGLDDYFVQLTIQYDSYSYGEYIAGIKLVKQSEITYTEFIKK